MTKWQSRQEPEIPMFTPNQTAEYLKTFTSSWESFEDMLINELNIKPIQNLRLIHTMSSMTDKQRFSRGEIYDKEVEDAFKKYGLSDEQKKAVRERYL